MRLHYLKPTIGMIPDKVGLPQAVERQRTRALHTGTKAWRTLREAVLLRDLYVCQACQGIANQVDHKDGDSHNNVMSNLQSLCHSCHSEKTAREQAPGGGKSSILKG